MLERLGEMLRPGLTTLELDDAAYAMITEAGATPSPLNYHGYPKSICTSVNEVVCHGIPGPQTLVEGDIINVDVTTYLEGYHGDCSKTFIIGEASEEARRLVEVTELSLKRAIEIVRPGAPFTEIGAVIHALADQFGYGVVVDFCGHGIGRKFHEDPHILHYRNSRTSKKMKAGMVFTIEPMINVGGAGTKTLKDNWTAVTTDGKLSAQFEHTVAVTRNGYDVLTALEGEFPDADRAA